jgi:heme-degrading monooxygenase HmoA
MPYMVVRHKVMDYAKWKPIYDQHAATRKASGSKKAHLFRNADNPNEIIILFEWDDLGKARSFARSDDLVKTMQKAGVSDKPDIYFLEEIERTSAGSN